MNSSRSPRFFLLMMAAAVPLAHTTWRTLLNNFAIEQIGFNGFQIGILQSLREVPGLLAFSVIYILLWVREQRLALFSLFLLGLGVALTGRFPTACGFYFTTFFMSIGFHYYETMEQSLTLQWIEREKVGAVLGQLVSAASFASLFIFAAIWAFLHFFKMPYAQIYFYGGLATMLVATLAFFWFPKFPESVEQQRKIVLKKKYGLYYALVFFSGARRQIFIVFAGFLMVEKFGLSASNMVLLFLANHLLNLWIAPKVGRLIGRVGERVPLLFEYAALVFIFIGYAVVADAKIAAGLYLIDNLFFSLSFAIKSYFKKIAEPQDISSTSGIGSTINHIVAVFIPIAFGAMWLHSSNLVFLSGAGLAGISFLCSLFVPKVAGPGFETILKKRMEVAV